MTIRFKLFLEQNPQRALEKKVVDIMPYFEGELSAALRAIKNGSVLYRATVKALRNEITLLDTLGMDRKSISTNNVYQLMMDSSPSLSEFPSRSKSLICSTSFRATGIYGFPHVILPFNETYLALSSSDDFIMQEVKNFGGVTTSIGNISDAITDVLNALEIHPASDKFTNLHELDKKLSEINFKDEDLIRKLLHASQYNEQTALIQLMRKAPRDRIFSFIAEKQFTPGNLGLSLVRFGNALPTVGRETWFSGKAIALHPSAFMSILGALEEKGYPVSDSFADIRSYYKYF